VVTSLGSFALVRRPASLRRCAARLPGGPGSDAGRRNAVSIVGARPSREVDRGRHDLCGFAAIPAGGLASRMRRFPSRHAVLKAPLEGRLAVPTLALFSPGGRWRMRWAPQTPQIGKISTAKRSIDIRTPGKLRPARLGGGYAGESSADAERPAQEEAATEIDEIIVTGQRDYLYRADQSDALGTSIPLAELPATVNVITEDFLEDTGRAYDIEDV
jgi:hypothetical protein